MLNNLVIIGSYFSRFSDEFFFLDSGVDRQPVIQRGLRVQKIVGIQEQSCKNLDPQTLLFKIAPEFPLFSIHKDPTVSLVAYQLLNSKSFSEILGKVLMAISLHMVCKKHKNRFFYSGQMSEKSTRNWQQKKYRKK